MVILIVVMISKMSIADHCIDFATCYSSHWIFTSTLLKPYSKLTNLISCLHGDNVERILRLDKKFSMDFTTVSLEKSHHPDGKFALNTCKGED